jgi:hypothetical protein
MLHGHSIHFAHATPIDHNDMSLTKIVHNKNLSYGGQPSEKLGEKKKKEKKKEERESLGPPNTLSNSKGKESHLYK